MEIMEENIENRNSEILTHLKTLGLEAGATPDDIHAAFRKFARELHPDVTGSKSDFRFKQITSAYTALKNVTAEELSELEAFISKIQLNKPRLKRDIYDYYSAEKKRRTDDQKINSILDKYEEELKNLTSANTSRGDLDIEAAALRLKSKNPRVINATLKHSAALVNRVEFRRVIAEVLNNPEIEINDELAGIISSLPFNDTTRQLIAFDVSGNAEKFPTGLIIALTGTNADVMENFLLHVKPDDVSVILRRWPSGKTMNASVTRRLLESNDARILVPLLGAMKTHFPSQASQHSKRLSELENHSSAAVRAWAKKCR